MDDDLGWAGRLHEPSERAPVRRLHIDDVGGPTPSEEWYETVRLTGHITGSARATSTSSPPAPAQNAVVLDWRRTEAPSPSMLERLGRNFAGRRYRPRRRDLDGLARTRAHAARSSAVAAPDEAVGHGTLQEQELAAGVAAEQPRGPRIGLRGDSDQPLIKAR